MTTVLEEQPEMLPIDVDQLTLDELTLSPIEFKAYQVEFKDPLELREHVLGRLQAGYSTVAGMGGEMLFRKLRETFCADTLELQEQAIRLRHILSELRAGEDRVYSFMRVIAEAEVRKENIQEYEQAGYRSLEAYEADQAAEAAFAAKLDEAVSAGARHLKPSDLTVEKVLERDAKSLPFGEQVVNLLGIHTESPTAQHAALRLKARTEEKMTDIQRFATEKLETGKVSAHGELARRVREASPEVCRKILNPEASEPKDQIIVDEQDEVLVVDSVDVPSKAAVVALSETERAARAKGAADLPPKMGRVLVQNKYVQWNVNYKSQG